MPSVFGVYDKQKRLWGLSPTKALGDQVAKALNSYFRGTSYVSRPYTGAVKIVGGKRAPAVDTSKMLKVQASHGGKIITWGQFNDPEAGIVSKALTELFLWRVIVATDRPSTSARVMMASR